jgi:hypothetical protein
MKTSLISWVAVAAVTSVGFCTVVRADALHGYCAGVSQCGDNGTNSPTSNNPPVSFGFTVSPGPASGNWLVDILVPSNDFTSAPTGVTASLTGTKSGTVSLFSATPWTSGQLDAYLGFKASPANPIGAYLPSTQSFDTGATGFYVFQANLGMTTLQGPSNPNISPLENLSSPIPQGSYIVSFLNEGSAGSPNWVATANSGAIFETSPTCVGSLCGTPRTVGVPGPSVGVGLPGLAMGGLALYAFYRRRRQEMMV